MRDVQIFGRPRHLRDWAAQVLVAGVLVLVAGLMFDKLVKYAVFWIAMSAASLIFVLAFSVSKKGDETLNSDAVNRQDNGA